MKQYPTIDRRIRFGEPVYVFDKLDGSNLRAEWSPKKGWYKFGKRNGLLDDTNPILRDEGPPLFLDKYGDDIARVCRDNRMERVIVYFEFWGPGSFAGNHEAEPHDVTLFDVHVHRKGILEPKDFLRLFGNLDVPALLHQGNLTHPMVEEIQQGVLEGMTFEGVVCKGTYRQSRKPGRPMMFKVKNHAWIGKLKEFCGDNMRLFEKLL